MRCRALASARGAETPSSALRGPAQNETPGLIRYRYQAGMFRRACAAPLRRLHEDGRRLERDDPCRRDLPWSTGEGSWSSVPVPRLGLWPSMPGSRVNN